MRTIKFRFWREPYLSEENINGVEQPVKKIPGEMLYYPETIFEINGRKETLDLKNYLDGSSITMQFTGLIDKDGKEIYEGDIVSIDEDFDSWYGGEIKFEKGAFYVDCEDFFGWDEDYELKVKGNIYENPELLQEGK